MPKQWLVSAGVLLLLFVCVAYATGEKVDAGMGDGTAGPSLINHRPNLSFSNGKNNNNRDTEDDDDDDDHGSGSGSSEGSGSGSSEGSGSGSSEGSGSGSSEGSASGSSEGSGSGSSEGSASGSGSGSSGGSAVVVAYSSGPGCANGISSQVLSHNVTACEAPWSGEISGAGASGLCGAGYHVCRHTDYHTHLQHLSYAGAMSLPGCYAFDAAHDFGQCIACTGMQHEDDLGGYGADCAREDPFAGAEGRSCLGDGRIDSDCCNAYTTPPGCSAVPGVTTGVLCCETLGDDPHVVTVSGNAPEVDINFRVFFDVQNTGGGKAGCFGLTGSDCVHVPEPAWGSGQTDLTIEAWVKLTANVPTTHVIYSAGSALRLEFDGSGGQGLRAVLGSTVLKGPGIATMSLFNWHHVALVIDGGAGRARLYLDGGVLDEKPWSGPAPTDLLHSVGCARAPAVYGAWKGKLEEVRVFTAVREPYEDVLRTPDSHLALYYSFNSLGYEDESKVRDYSFQWRDGTLSGQAYACPSDAPIGSGVFDFYSIVNHENDEAYTVDFFEPGGIRTPGTCANRQPRPTESWYNLFHPQSPPYRPYNFLFDGEVSATHQNWFGRVDSAPLEIPENLLAATMANNGPEYRTATRVQRGFSIPDLLGCRSHGDADLAPLVVSGNHTESTSLAGRFYITSNQAFDLDNEALGEVMKRCAIFRYNLCVNSLYGSILSFVSDTMLFRITHTTIHFDGDGEMTLTFVTHIEHMDQTYVGEPTTRLYSPYIVASPGSTGFPSPDLYFGGAYPSSPPCLPLHGLTQISDRFVQGGVPPGWSFVSNANIVNLACPGDEIDRYWLKVPKSPAPPARREETGIPFHTHMRVGFRVLLTGPWLASGANGELVVRVQGLASDLLRTGFDVSSAAATGTLCPFPAQYVVVEYDIHALPRIAHLDETETAVTFRVEGAAAGVEAYVDDIRVDFETDPAVVCMQEWTVRTSGEQSRTDFRGHYDLQFTPHIQGTPAPDRNVHGVMVVDARRNRAWDDLPEPDCVELQSRPVVLYSDAALVDEELTFTTGDRIHAVVELDVPREEAAAYRPHVTQIRICTPTIQQPIAEFDRDNEATTGCNTPGLGLVTTVVYDYDEPWNEDPGFNASPIEFPPLVRSTQAGVAFDATPAMAPGMDLYIEIRYRVSLVIGAYTFERVDAPGIALAPYTQLELLPSGQIQDGSSNPIRAFMDGYAANAGVSGELSAAPYTGPFYIDPYGKLYAGTYGDTTPDVPGLVLQSLALPDTRPINYALRLRGQADPGSGLEWSHALAQDVDSHTVEWYWAVQGDDIPPVGTRLFTLSNGVRESACELGGVSPNFSIDCHSTVAGAGPSTISVPVTQPLPVDRLRHYAFSAQESGGSWMLAVYENGQPMAPLASSWAPVTSPADHRFASGTTLELTSKYEGAGVADGVMYVDEFRVWPAARVPTEVLAWSAQFLTNAQLAQALAVLRLDDYSELPSALPPFPPLFVHNTADVAVPSHGLIMNPGTDANLAAGYYAIGHQPLYAHYREWVGGAIDDPWSHAVAPAAVAVVSPLVRARQQVPHAVRHTWRDLDAGLQAVRQREAMTCPGSAPHFVSRVLELPQDQVNQASIARIHMSCSLDAKWNPDEKACVTDDRLHDLVKKAAENAARDTELVNTASHTTSEDWVEYVWIGVVTVVGIMVVVFIIFVYMARNHRKNKHQAYENHSDYDPAGNTSSSDDEGHHGKDGHHGQHHTSNNTRLRAPKSMTQNPGQYTNRWGSW